MHTTVNSTGAPHKASTPGTSSPKSSNTCGYLLVALGIIVLIGSLVATGCLFSYMGYSSFAIGGGGILFGAICFLLKRYCCNPTPPLESQSPLPNSEQQSNEPSVVMSTPHQRVPTPKRKERADNPRTPSPLTTTTQTVNPDLIPLELNADS